MTPEHFTDEHRNTVCKIGQGVDCCRYLTMGAGGWSCEKHSSLRFTLDRRAESGEMRSVGDNCEGIFERRPAFRLLHDRFEHKAGAVIYQQAGYDYGLSNDDERATGIPHTTMTLDPAGGYPGFTVPNSDFEPCEQVPA